MYKKLLLFILLSLCFVSAQPQTPYTPQIITASQTVVPVSFFNDGEASYFNATLLKSPAAIELESPSTYVERDEFGSFNLRINRADVQEGVYFDTLSISNNMGTFQEIPIIVGIESPTSSLDYDVSIEFDPSTDLSAIGSSQETVISPTLNVYKLNYNARAPNGLSLVFFVYSVDGELLFSSEDIVSVSRRSSFDYVFNIGSNLPSEILMVAFVKRGESVGLDFSQVSLMQGVLLSPDEGRDYSSRIYMGVFVFLLSSIILVSYLWHNRYDAQAKDWQSRLDRLKKTKFSDAAKGLRKLEAQRSVLQRAYSNHYISKTSFDSATSQINHMAAQLKKRL